MNTETTAPQTTKTPINGIRPTPIVHPQGIRGLEGVNARMAAVEAAWKGSRRQKWALAEPVFRELISRYESCGSSEELLKERIDAAYRQMTRAVRNNEKIPTYIG